MITALEAAAKRGWTVVDMKRDWKKVFAVSAPGDAMDLLGNAWLVEDIDGRGVVDNARTTAEFADDAAVSGNTSVNRYTGKATIDGNKLSFGPLAATRRAGPPALIDQEQRFFKAIDAVVKYEFTHPGIVVFQDAQGNNRLRLSLK